MKQNIKLLKIDKHGKISFPLQRHLVFSKENDLLFKLFFIRLDCYMPLSKFTWKQINITSFSLYVFSFPFLVFFKNFMFVLFVLIATYILGRSKNYNHKYTLQCHLCRGLLMIDCILFTVNNNNSLLIKTFIVNRIIYR